MRLALVCHYLPPHEGGIERVVQRLALEYEALGVEPVIAAWGHRDAASNGSTQMVRLPGINPLERVGVPVPLIEPVQSTAKLHRVLHGVDALHVHGLPYVSSYLAMTLAARMSIRTLVTEHVGTVPYASTVLSRAQDAALALGCALARRSAVAVTVLNDAVAALLGPKVDPVPVVKVANGVDLDLFRPAGPEERSALRAHFGIDGPTVLAVGRHVPKKGLQRVADAVDGEGLRAILVGAGTAGLSRGLAVRTYESLPQDDLARLYRAVDALALPSEGEGLPMVVQEALASGLPVVMGDDPAVRAEIPEEAVTFVPPTDVRSLTLALHEALAGGNDRRAAARRSASARWSWRESAKQYLDLLQPT